SLDVLLMCDDGIGGKSFQIWVNNKDDGFSLALEGPLPSGVQSISFADIDRDGTIDMVFTTCSSVSTSSGLGSGCYINIAFNQQLKLCPSSTDTGIKNGIRTCRPHNDLCTADPDFKFNLTDTPDNDVRIHALFIFVTLTFHRQLFVRFPLSALYPDSPSLLALDTTYSPPLLVSLKLGDANLDGFPDFLIILGSGKERFPSLVLSVPCAPGVVGCPSNGAGRRGWEVAKKGVESLTTIRDARAVSFLDLDEDGTLDIMVQMTGESGRGNFLFIQNNFYYDAFFLKAIVLNGACDNGWCYAPNSSERYHPFGVSYSGASYKYTVLDTSGHRSAAQVGQLPQTSYHALQLPYSFFGLGRTNNYIENLFVGSTVHAQEHYINMEGVIPNSKVVILPSTNEDEAWKRQLFLRPGEWVPWVTVTVVAGTGLLAIIVFVLHLNEKVRVLFSESSKMLDTDQSSHHETSLSLITFPLQKDISYSLLFAPHNAFELASYRYIFEWPRDTPGNTRSERSALSSACSHRMVDDELARNLVKRNIDLPEVVEDDFYWSRGVDLATPTSRPSLDRALKSLDINQIHWSDCEAKQSQQKVSLGPKIEQIARSSRRNEQHSAATFSLTKSVKSPASPAVQGPYSHGMTYTRRLTIY
ncbi:hypothetical protein H0H81_009019, partial [Sphagnurus paluster]